MLITVILFSYIWFSDFKRTKGNIKERAVFLALFSLSLFLAVLISKDVNVVSPVKVIQNVFDYLHISY